MRKEFRKAVWLLAVLAMSGWAHAQPAEQAAKDFEELFGRQIRQGKGVRSAAGDVALARRICGAARGASVSDELMTLLCENAHQLAAPHPEGLDLAAEALQLLARKVPAKADECSRKLLDVQIRRFALAQGTLKMQLGEECVGGLTELADEKAEQHKAAEALALLRQAERIARENRSDTVRLVQSRLREVEMTEAAWGRVEPLRARVAAAPEDRSARESLVTLLLVELDDPAEAGKYLTPESDQAQRTYIPLAGGADKGLTEATSLELARWYAGLSGTRGRLGELVCLRRAKRYYDCYFRLHTAKDAAMLKAQGELAKVAAGLESLGPRAATDWTGVLRLADVSKHARWGTWSRTGATVEVTKKTDNARLTIPICPVGSYELRGQFTRTEGAGGIRLVLPVRQTSCTLVLGEGKDAMSGLERAGGKDFRQSEARADAAPCANNILHTVTVKVVTIGDRVTVTASLDEKEVVRWKGAQGSLSPPKDWDTTNPGALGLGADRCLASFASLDIRMLSGTIAQADIDETKARHAQEERIRREKERAAREKDNGDPPRKKRKKSTGK